MGGITIASNAGGGLLTSAREADPNFLTATLVPYYTQSGKKRIDKLTNQHKSVGVIYFSRLGETPKLQVLYLPRAVTKKNDVETSLLGTTSNVANSIRPKLLPNEVTKNVLVVANKEDVPEGFATGKVIDKELDTLKAYFVDESGNLKDNLEKVVVRVPIGVVLPYQAVINTGIVEQATFDCLTNVDPENDSLCFWARSVLSHNSDLQATLLRDTALKPYVPPMPSTGHHYRNTPFISAQNVDEEADDLEDEVEALSSDCTDIATRNMKSVVALEEKDPSNMTLEFEQVPKAKLQYQASNESLKAPTITERDQIFARIKAFGAIYDPVTGQVSSPELSDFMEGVLDAGSSKGAQRDAAISTLSSIEETVADSDHFLLRSVDLPTFDNITASFFAQALFCKDAQYALESSRANGLVPQMLLPDTAATAKTKSESLGHYEAEEAIGEFESKRTKLDTSFTAATEITSTGVAITGMANFVVSSHLYYRVDLTSTTPCPGIVYSHVEIAKLLTTKRAKAWMKKNRQNQVQLLYYAVGCIMSIFTCYARASRDVVVTSSILRNDWSSVKVSDYKLAHTILNDCKEMLERIFLGSITVPTNDLYKNSKAKQNADDKQRKKLLQEAAAMTSPRGKDERDRRGSLNGGGRRASLKDDKSSSKRQKTGDKKGYIKCDTGITDLNLPKPLHNKSYKLCKSNVRDDTICTFGEDCIFDHSSPMELEDDMAKVLVNYVDNTEGLSFVNVPEDWLKRIRSL